MVSYLSKLADFHISHLQLAPSSKGRLHWNFAEIFRIRKKWSPGLSCVCVIMCLAVLTQYRLVTDKQTDGRTDRQRDRQTDRKTDTVP